MLIKVCGINREENLARLKYLKLDYIGFIFYQKSKRCFHSGDLKEEDLASLNQKRVGVFVNETNENIRVTARRYQLDVLQLHGEESPDQCQELKSEGYEVWKAFPVYDELPNGLEEYTEQVTAFLFDTKGKEHGGNGVKFDWSVLDAYDRDVPFVLSGGIDSKDHDRIKTLKHKKLIGIDVNSKFEIEPGYKDVNLLKEFVDRIKK